MRAIITASVDLLPDVGQEVEDALEELVAVTESAIADYGVVANIGWQLGTETTTAEAVPVEETSFPISAGALS